MVSWLVPAKFICWNHAPCRKSQDRIMFSFWVDGLGVAACFCTAKVLTKSKRNPKFKVDDRFHLRAFVVQILGDKFKSNYDASKGLKTALTNTDLIIRVERDLKALSDKSLRIASILDVHKASRMSEEDRAKAYKTLDGLLGFRSDNPFEGDESPSRVNVEQNNSLNGATSGSNVSYLGAKTGLDEDGFPPF